MSTLTLNPQNACAARKKRSRPGGLLQVVRREQVGLLRHVTRGHAARVRLNGLLAVTAGHFSHQQKGKNIYSIAIGFTDLSTYAQIIVHRYPGCSDLPSVGLNG